MVNKTRDWDKIKRDVKASLIESCVRFNKPGLDVACEFRKRQRVGFFTTDNVRELEVVLKENQDKELAKDKEWMEQLKKERERWNELRAIWESTRESKGVPAEKPGVFRVSQNYNTSSNSIKSFIGAFKNEGDARMAHPGGGSSCEYNLDPLSRHEEWLKSHPTRAGPAPAWWLGPGDAWCHGAYNKVKKLSVYDPPDGDDTNWGIWCVER